MKSKLENQSVLELLKVKFGENIVSFEESFDLLTVEVATDSLHDVISWLKSDPTLAISFLTNLGAVHYPDNQGRELAIVYHLHSLTNNFRIRLKAYISIEKPEIRTITDIHLSANWMERETYDFYGVQFIGHPNLKRILNEDSMDYFPMRKEYHLEDATREDKDDRFFGR
jgi:NADH-quinone oxidoreductase subunit C